MRRFLLRGLALVSLAACSHSEPMPTDPTPLSGTLVPDGQQLTYNAGDDYGTAWSADGRSILYAYSLGATATLPRPPRYGTRCIGILPLAGGTRSFDYCDDRSVNIDSVSMYGGLALNTRGDLLFTRATSRVQSLAPVNHGVWVTDTVDPLGHLRLIKALPVQMGAENATWLSEVEWTGDQTFVAAASTVRIQSRTAPGVYDTLFIPRGLVKGNIARGSEALAMIPGTEQAGHWSQDGTGALLYVRGISDPFGTSAFVRYESLIRRIAADGGSHTQFATVPDNQPIRSISCRQDACLVLSTAFYKFIPSTRTFYLIHTAGATAADAVLAPDSRSFAYRLNGNIMREPMPF